MKQIENWREGLAIDIIANNTGFNNEEINFLVQRLLNRIIFLRICEDREIEKYETLKHIKSYDELKALFVRSDKNTILDFSILSRIISLLTSKLIQVFLLAFSMNYIIRKALMIFCC